MVEINSEEVPLSNTNEVILKDENKDAPEVQISALADETCANPNMELSDKPAVEDETNIQVAERISSEAGEVTIEHQEGSGVESELISVENEQPEASQVPDFVKNETCEVEQETQKDKPAQETVPKQSNEHIDEFSDDDIIIDESGDSSSSEDDTTSSESESSSDSSDDSDSDSESEDESSVSKARQTVDELEEEDEAPSGPILSKNEVTKEEAVVLPEDYTIPENAPLEFIGNVSALVENSVIIKANTSGEFRILKDNSVLCFEDRQLLGPLFETFGRLQAPVYRVKFNTEEEFEKFKDKKGSKVFYVVPESQFVYTDAIKKMKGTDASNCHDEELPEEEQDYSDDERELAAKQEKTRKRKQKKQENGEPTQPKKVPASKPESSFMSYGFAEQKAEQSKRSTEQIRNQTHHNPALHGTAASPHPAQNTPSAYGVPLNQAQSAVYGQAPYGSPMQHAYQGYQNAQSYAQPQQPYAHQQPYVQQQQYVPQQSYVQQQAYVQQQPYAQQQQPYIQQPYGQFQQPHQGTYGQPFPHAPPVPQIHQTQQYQQYPYAQPHYGQSQQQQGIPQMNPGHQHPQSQPVNYPTQPPQPNQQNEAGSSNNVLQQLQQMVSQNLNKEKSKDAN